MHAGPVRSVEPPSAPTMGDGAQAWSALCARLVERARLDAEIVELTGAVARSGTIETLEGVTLDTALNLVHRIPAAERGMLLTAADVLADMPATMALLKAGVVSWGQVRGIVAEVKRLPKVGRGIVDAHIGASADRFGKWDPDEAVDAVRIVVDEVRGLRAVERSAAAVQRSSFVWAQPGMMGRGKLFAEMDNLSLATVVNRIDAFAPADDGRPVGQRRADGLVTFAAHSCDDEVAAAIAAGHAPDLVMVDDTVGETPRRRTRHPVLGRRVGSVDVIVDIRDVTVTAAGVVLVNAPGCLPTLTARVVDALAQDGAVRAVLVDGARPLAVTKKVEANTVAGDTRIAVKLRDRGDRFPGSRGPLGQVHLHHINKPGQGHDPDALVGLMPHNHQRVHRCGWKITIDPPTGEVTFTRGNRSWTTLPRGTRLRRPLPRDPDPPDAGRDDRGPPDPDDPADPALPF